MTFSSVSPTTMATETATQAMVMRIAAWVITGVKRSVTTPLKLLPLATIPSIMSLTLAMMPTA